MRSELNLFDIAVGGLGLIVQLDVNEVETYGEILLVRLKRLLQQQVLP